jgi:multiple sugar transport system ATP-binding protein
MTEVVLEHVGKTYPNGVRAVRDVSLRVSPGELVVLVGPSGSGKTTTLRLIAGLEAPTSGLIRIAGRVVNREAPHRRNVAMVFQRPALYPHLDVRANLGFGLALRGPPFWLARIRRWLGTADPVAERIGEVARLLRLDGLLDRRPAELSGGQQQRVALGRALVRRPAVFLFDEPLSNLDARLRLEMRRELHLLHRRLRATMIYVTHDQEEALALGDRVAVLDRGQVQQADRPEALYERPANRFVAEFFGWPPMNSLDGELVDRDGCLSLVGGEAVLSCQPVRARWLPFAGRKVVLGIRPGHVGLLDAPHAPGPGVLAMNERQVERLGPVRLVTAERGGWTVTATREGGPPPGPSRETGSRDGSPVGVAFDLSRAHLFDQATGQVLSHGGAEG